MRQKRLIPQRVAFLLPHEIIGLLADIGDHNVMCQHGALDAWNEKKHGEIMAAPKSSVCPSKPKETKLFDGIFWDFCRDILEVPERFEKKFVFNFWPLILCLMQLRFWSF